MTILTHATPWSYLVIAAWLFFLQLSASDTSALERILGDAVLDALHYARLEVKAAAAIMRVDESNFRKALRGEPGREVSLTKLIRLPFVFWMAFGPSLIYLVAKANVQAVAEDLGLRRSA